MTHRIAYLTAYDTFGKIHVVAEIKDFHRITSGQAEVEFSTAATVQGTGEQEPAEWLQQALLGLLESL